MTAHFGQFLDHDISLTPEIETKCCEGGGYPFRAKRSDLLDIKQDISFVDYQDFIKDFPGSDFSNPDCFNIDIPDNDTFFTKTKCLGFARSDAFCDQKPREQYNAITAFVDGSNIYGSDDETASSLRYVLTFIYRSRKFQKVYFF